MADLLVAQTFRVNYVSMDSIRTADLEDIVSAINADGHSIALIYESESIEGSSYEQYMTIHKKDMEEAIEFLKGQRADYMITDNFNAGEALTALQEIYMNADMDNGDDDIHLMSY